MSQNTKYHKIKPAKHIRAINRITYSEGIKFLPFWEGPDDGERAQDSFAYSNPIKVEAITLKKHEM